MVPIKGTAAAGGFLVACLAVLLSAPAYAQAPALPTLGDQATHAIAPSAAPGALARSAVREARQMAASAQVEDPARRVMILAGGITFASIYAATIVGDYAIDPDTNFPQLWVPIIGPFLAYGDYDNKVSPDYAGSTADKTLFIASGIIQAASATVFIMGITRPTSRASRTMAKIPAIAVTPTRHGGFKLTCLKRF